MGINIDLEITKGSYWGGSQLPYWALMIMTAVPVLGMLGIDHLLLRSPHTAILKFLTLIPLMGYWYFFDIAQVFGERENVEKYGLSVPFLGPQGIGAGMFFEGNPKVSAPDMPRPWRFMLYFLGTLFFIVFPINKLLIGDYLAAGIQFLWYFLFPMTFLAIGWGFYDAYKLLTNPREVLEEGPARIPPASWIIDPHFNKSVLGPLPHKEEDIGLIRLMKKALFTTREITDAGLSVASMKARAEKSIADFVPTVVGSATAATASIAPAVSMAIAEGSMKLSQQVPELTQKVANLGVNIGKSAAKAAADLPETIRALGPVLAKEIPNAIRSIPGVDRVAAAAGVAADAVSGSVKSSSEAVSKSIKDSSEAFTKSVQAPSELLQKLPEIGEQVAGQIKPEALLAQAKVQSGGSLLRTLNSTINSVHQKAIIVRNASDKVHDALVDLSQQVPDLLTTSITETGDIVVKGVESAVSKVQNVLNVIPAVPQDETIQSGGARAAAGVASTLIAAAGMSSQEGISVSTSVLLLSVALLAAGGFVMYTLRKALKAKADINEQNDTPPEARDVRESAKA